MVATCESAALAEKLIAATCAKQGITRGQLSIHADRGSSMTSKPVALLLADLGVTQTHSRPHVSNDNPLSEAQFKTLKYRPEFPERFGSIEAARAHCRIFFSWYNTEHRHSGIGRLTAHDVHYGLADQRIAARAGVLTAAYAAHPERFVVGVPRPPAGPTEVWINPPPATATSTSNPASAGSEKDGGAFRAPYSHAAESGGPDLRTKTQQLSITRLPAAIANEADEPATTEAALH